MSCALSVETTLAGLARGDSGPRISGRTTGGPMTDDRVGRQPACQPQLSVRQGRAAVEFYQRAFGAVQEYRVGGTDENEAVGAQFSVGDAWFWVADESPEHANFSPQSLGGGSVRMLLITDDPVALAGL